MKYLEKAKQAAEHSLDPSTKVGACLVSNNQKSIITGCNYIPGASENDIFWEDKRLKQLHVIHAEMSVLLTAGQLAQGASLFITHPPCSECAKNIIAADIAEIYWYEAKPHFRDRWDCNNSIEIFDASDIIYKEVSCE